MLSSTGKFNFVESITGGLLGFIIALAFIGLEISLRKVRFKIIFLGIIGLIIGLVTGLLVVNAFESVLPTNYSDLSKVLIPLILGYLGMAVSVSKSDQLQLGDAGLTYGKAQATTPVGEYKILDTSVIIDGRIADIAETGFVSGTFIIPRFVLLELQHIADSSDPMRRKRGRRGLDILNKLQKSNYPVEIVETDFPSVPAVDSKLIELAKAMTSPIITNDFNLNKVAELQGVKVLNINDLANALRPVVLPGEEFKVFILREGKEYNQGVGYLDDGTMVVVDSGRNYLNQKVEVVVTSVLQTTAGRMIFARIADEEV
jgi:uncharacterized protein YacL